MKYFMLITGIVLFTGLSFAFKKAPKTPPGTTYWKDNLYMDAKEISNLSWKEYVYWLKQQEGEDAAKAAMPDFEVWLSIAENKPFTTHYYQHEAYHDYPVVGISHQQAKDYCAWRTKVVNETRKAQDGKLLYRLPTKKEWESVAALPLKKSAKAKKYDGQSEMLYNLRRSEKQDHITTPTGSYLPNEIGSYNMIGNVAEMVAEEGIAKGGSWHHNYEDSKPTQDLEYTEATDWLGFRCICELAVE